MKRRNLRLVVACALIALVVAPSLAVAFPGPGLGVAAHQEKGGWSLTALTSWLGELGSSLWGVLSYDASKQHAEIEKAGALPDPNGVRQFQRVGAAPGTETGAPDDGG